MENSYPQLSFSRLNFIIKKIVVEKQKMRIYIYTAYTHNAFIHQNVDILGLSTVFFLVLWITFSKYNNPPFRFNGF